MSENEQEVMEFIHPVGKEQRHRALLGWDGGPGQPAQRQQRFYLAVGTTLASLHGKSNLTY